MTDNQLIPIDTLGGGAIATVPENFDDLVGGANYLPRIQLYGANSGAVKEDKIGQGRFGLVLSKDDITDLGKTFDCIPLGVRLKAMEIGEEIVNTYDHQSDEFKRIQAMADEPDSGCMWGGEFLLWLPSQQKFALYFLSSKSARREAKPLRGQLGRGTTIEANLVKWKKYSWHAPKVMGCSTPLQTPDPDKMRAELERFNNPVSNVPERVEADEAAATSRDR